jgi:uncharacterized membrane protein YgdD (TMEM256/DUF423 family)
VSTEARGFAALAALLLALATVAGALAAHTLSQRLAIDQLDVLQTAVRYQFFHALGLLGVALLLDRVPEPERARLLRVAAWLLGIGIVLFCGSLYVLLAGLSGALGVFVGVLTPLGGLCLIAAWMLVALALLRKRRSS